MSEIEPAGKHRTLKPRKQRKACKAGNHAWSEPVHSGGGICRLTCDGCGSIMLDIRESELVVPVATFDRRGLWQ